MTLDDLMDRLQFVHENDDVDLDEELIVVDGSTTFDVEDVIWDADDNTVQVLVKRRGRL